MVARSNCEISAERVSSGLQDRSLGYGRHIL